MEIMTIPCLHDNYSYLIAGIGGNEAAIIDPSEARPILQLLEHRGLTLKQVLCTHHHNDHLDGLDELLDTFPGVRVFGLRADQPRIPRLTELLDDGARFSLGTATARLMHTPGHTSGGVVYLIDGHLFTGDTLFGAGCGRLFEGTPGQMVRSLARIVACGNDTKLYFGHEYTLVNLRFAGEIEPGNRDIETRVHRVQEMRDRGRPALPSSVAEELRTNPFLRCGEPTVIRSLEQRVGLADHETVTVFAALRELRNHFS